MPHRTGRIALRTRAIPNAAACESFQDFLVLLRFRNIPQNSSSSSQQPEGPFPICLSSHSLPEDGHFGKMLALHQRGCVSSWGCTAAPSRQCTVCKVMRKGTKEHAKTRPKKLSASAKRHRGGAIYDPLPPKPAHFEILSGPSGAASTTSSSTSASSSPAAPGSDNEPSSMAQAE